MHLAEQTGYSEETIYEAFDCIMDYCTKGGESAGLTFSTGKLAWTEEGKAHFDDVERLFRLDFQIAAVTGILLLAYLICRMVLRIAKKCGDRLKPQRFLGRGPLFWGPAVIFAAIGAAVIAAFADYEGFFVWFHHVFFPGRENWLLDPELDEIIRILPDEVLQHYALIIAGLLAAGCMLCILPDFILHRKKRIR